MVNPQEVIFDPCPLEEQETTINLSYQDKKAYVYTSRINVARRLLEMCEAHTDEASIRRLNSGGLEIEVPLNWIIIRPKQKRELTEEQRRELAERLQSVKAKSA